MLTEDTTRIMSRVKAVFRGQAIPCHGKSIYRPDRREAYLAQFPTEGCGSGLRCFTKNSMLCIACASVPNARCSRSAATIRP